MTINVGELYSQVKIRFPVDFDNFSFFDTLCGARELPHIKQLNLMQLLHLATLTSSRFRSLIFIPRCRGGYFVFLHFVVLVNEPN